MLMLILDFCMPNFTRKPLDTVMLGFPLIELFSQFTRLGSDAFIYDITCCISDSIKRRNCLCLNMIIIVSSMKSQQLKNEDSKSNEKYAFLSSLKIYDEKLSMIWFGTIWLLWSNNIEPLASSHSCVQGVPIDSVKNTCFDYIWKVSWLKMTID